MTCRCRDISAKQGRSGAGQGRWFWIRGGGGVGRGGERCGGLERWCRLVSVVVLRARRAVGRAVNRVVVTNRIP